MMQTTIELPDELATQVRAIAESSNRPVAEVLTEAITQGLAYDRWFRAQVAEGLHAAGTEPLLPAEQVWDDFLRRGLLTPEAISEAEVEADIQEEA